jgi:hypothetical protein
MNKMTGKWLVRAGSLIILLGFFLPSMAVSCSALGAKQAFSLYTIATSPYASTPFLFMVLLGAIVAAVFSVIPAKTRQQHFLFLIGQLVSVGVGALSLFISVLTLYSQFSGTSGSVLGGIGVGLDYSLEFGFFVLLLGYILSGTGIIIQFLEGKQLPARLSPLYPQASSAPPPVPIQQPSGMEAASRAAGPRLEVRGGDLPFSVFPLKDNLYVGRGSECQLRLPGSQVSRLHARFRLGNGSWFIQDQGSTAGTFVNGQRVQATRLNPGDQIKIGNILFVFRM